VNCKLKGFERKQTWPKWIIILQFTWRDWGEPREFSMKIAGIPVGVQRAPTKYKWQPLSWVSTYRGAYIYIYICLKKKIYICMPDARSRWRLLLGWWRSIFLGLHYGTRVVWIFPVHSEVAPRCGKSVHPIYIYIFGCKPVVVLTEYPHTYRRYTVQRNASRIAAIFVQYTVRCN
jgi:hypothetical protein